MDRTVAKADFQKNSVLKGIKEISVFLWGSIFKIKLNILEIVPFTENRSHNILFLNEYFDILIVKISVYRSS